MTLSALARRAVFLPVLFLWGCAVHVAYEGAEGAEAASIQSIGDTEFRFYRDRNTIAPTPYVMKINGKSIVHGDRPTSVGVPAGTHKLLVQCDLPLSEMQGQGTPFSVERDGIGQVTGHPLRGATANIVLTVAVEAGATYELRCESIGGLRARAWITKRQ